MTWKALNNESPTYMHDLLTLSASNLNLRSNHQMLLKIPRSHTKYGERAFSSMAPALWNSLPYQLSSAKNNEMFRNKLKTHLFHNSYQNP